MEITQKNIDLLDQQHFEQLLSIQDSSCVSIYMPARSDNTADPVEAALRLKNLLKQAQERFEMSGLRSSEAREILEPGYGLADNFNFWKQQSEGLALFFAPNLFHVYRLPIAFREIVISGPNFFIKPLLPLFRENGHFCILALSLDESRLLDCTRYQLEQRDTGDIPMGLRDLTKYKDYEASMQNNPSGASQAPQSREHRAVHGHGGSGQDSLREEERMLLLRKMSQGIERLLDADRPPLVLVGDAHICGQYRKVSHYDNLLDEELHNNPDSLPVESLHEKVWDIVSEQFTQDSKWAEDRFAHLSGTQDARSAQNIETIVPAAQNHRIDTLFVALDHEQWGSFEPDEQRVECFEDWAPGREDLLNSAVLSTLQNGGHVYPYLSSDKVPGSGEVAAIFRY